MRGGETYQAAAEAVGCSSKSVLRLLAKTGGMKPRPTARSALRLSLAEREEISRGLLAGDSCRGIAARLRRSPSSVSREVAAVGVRAIVPGKRTGGRDGEPAAPNWRSWSRRYGFGSRWSAACDSGGRPSRSRHG